MLPRPPCRATIWLISFCLLGCTHSVQPQVETLVAEFASQPLDQTLPVKAEAPPPPMPPATMLLAPPPASTASSPVTPNKPASVSSFIERLRLPASLPGGNPELPLPDKTAPPEVRREAIRKLFPPLPPLLLNPAPVPGPEGHPFTLAELQHLAMAQNPLIRQAAADVAAARGQARQAAAYPNPIVGYESSDVNSGGTAGYQGGFLEQLIKTAGKLRTAEASALMTLASRELALRRAQADLMAQVRSAYFTVLVSQFGMEVGVGLAEHTDAIYEVFREWAVGGLRPPYEAMELRALAIQSRGNLAQMQNRYRAAWRQLAAALGRIDMPPTQLAGSAESTVPQLQFDLVLAHILSSHTDIWTARAAQQKARYDLHLAQITPIPDVSLRVGVEKDYTTPPFNITENIQVGVALPLWDRNRGAIEQAEGGLLRASEEEQRVRNDLTSRLAEAFERYENQRLQARYYHDYIIPDYKKVFNLVLTLFAVQSEKAEYNLQFLDIVNNQQLYVNAVMNYLNTLSGQWAAVVDVASLLQTPDLFLEPADCGPAH
jgi:cobalt-zinc-cadmium efflux system outer membrane protein